tara:strand:- start:536 stop:910 length:375 start_codon:yes stop_codon:yes gene_type:complete
MSQIIAVGIGGFIGAISRYIFGILIIKNFSIPFPISTLFVNFFGCLLFGYFINHNLINHSNFPIKEFLLIGILGGFTTFSTFGFEFVSLIQKQQIQKAILYVSLSLILGVFAIWLGLKFNQIYS